MSSSRLLQRGIPEEFRNRIESNQSNRIKSMKSNQINQIKSNQSCHHTLNLHNAIKVLFLVVLHVVVVEAEVAEGVLVLVEE